MEEQKRHSGFETMRILSMVMIVLMHGIGHGGLGSAAPQGTAAFWIYWLLFILARVSTNCFVMLSGYYLSERKGPVHAGRLIRIGAQVWFYSMLTFCVAVKAGAVPLSAVALLRALLPLTSNGYWFASAYFLLYLSVPVLNAVVQSLDRRQYKTLLLVALLLAGILMVMGAYRIFSYLCENARMDTVTFLLGGACALLAVGGFLLARASFRRLKELHLGQ